MIKYFTTIKQVLISPKSLGRSSHRFYKNDTKVSDQQLPLNRTCVLTNGKWSSVEALAELVRTLLLGKVALSIFKKKKLVCASGALLPFKNKNGRDVAGFSG